MPVAPTRMVLEKNDSPCVLEELHRRQEDQAESAWASPANSSKWVAAHMDHCELHSLSWPVHQPPILADNPWFKVFPDREKELICFGLMEGLRFLDSSQSLGRTRDCKEDLVPTVLPGSHFWDYAGNRPLIGRDLMNLQGYPWSTLPAIDGFKEHQLADLAGNAFAATCSVAADVAMLFSIDYTVGDVAASPLEHIFRASRGDDAEFSL